MTAPAPDLSPSERLQAAAEKLRDNAAGDGSGPLLVAVADWLDETANDISDRRYGLGTDQALRVADEVLR